jgi:phosphoribosylanthranilate isomerase
MREPENIRAVEALNIDYMGFIFYPRSPRFVRDNAAAMEAICRCGKKKVGVFVNETAENILQKAELYRLDYLQLHGTESPGICGFLNAEGYRIIKSFSVGPAVDFEEANRYQGCVDYLLFDTKSAGYGGSGKRFEWSLMHKYNGNIPFLLSGGLAPDCLQDIFLFNHPKFAGVDLNSGFEISPALKDVEKLRDYSIKIRNYF